MKIDDLTVGHLRRSFGKYRPYLLTVLAVFMLAVVLPGTRQAEEEDVSAAASADLAPTGGAVDTAPEAVTTDTVATEGGTVDPAAPTAGATETGSTAPMS